VMYRVAARRLLTLGQVCAALSATPLIVLGTRPGFAVLAGAALVAGFGSGVANVAWDTTVQENIPDHLLSRMAAYDDFGSYVGIPIGQLSAGPLASAFGPGPVATTGGVVLAVAALVPLLSPAVRKMRHTPAEAGSPSAGI
jgi:MFS family permease